MNPLLNLHSNAAVPDPPDPADAASRRALVRELRSHVPPRRFAHSLGVALESVELARLWGVDTDRAWLAGLLHDCAKGIATERQVETCDALGVALDAETRAAPPVVHAFLGAYLARVVYGVRDEAVLRAISLHTVGGPDMTTLDKIVYLSDSTESGRDFPGVGALRDESRRSLDGALRLCVEAQLRRLAMKGAAAHPGTARLARDLGVSLA